MQSLCLYNWFWQASQTFLTSIQNSFIFLLTNFFHQIKSERKNLVAMQCPFIYNTALFLKALKISVFFLILLRCFTATSVFCTYNIVIKIVISSYSYNKNIIFWEYSHCPNIDLHFKLTPERDFVLLFFLFTLMDCEITDLQFSPQSDNYFLW